MNQSSFKVLKKFQIAANVANILTSKTKTKNKVKPKNFEVIVSSRGELLMERFCLGDRPERTADKNVNKLTD